MNKGLIKNYIFRKPARLILSMYLFSILVGTLLLMLPISKSVDSMATPLDTLFTTVSAICVTGLVTVTTATAWSGFGHLVIILLIQLGGLGVMTAASIVALIFNKKMTISDRINLTEEKNAVSIEGIVRIVKFVILSTFVIELIGAIFLSFTFIPDYGVLKGIWSSIFHSISAFCNAGFDIVSADSLAPYINSLNVSIVISLLIVVGGIGHVVYRDLLNNKLRFKKYSLHTKVALLTTGILLFGSTLFFLLIEYNNPTSIAGLTFKNKVSASFFQASTLRTAGFYTVRQDLFENASTILMLILMFIGGSPAGTAGGFKTTSFASLFFITKSNIMKEKDINVLGRRISDDVKQKIIAIFTISLAWIIVAMLIMSIVEPTIPSIDLIYEIISAYGTVGLTRGITPTMSTLSKVVIMMTMLFGKVGPLSIILAFVEDRKPKSYRVLKEDLLIG